MQAGAQETEGRQGVTLREMTRGRPLLLFLDFDGTLVELAETPDKIEVPLRLQNLLGELHRALDGRVCIVSGRSLADLEAFLPQFPGDMAGSHGAEFRLAGRHHPHPAAQSATLSRLLEKAQQFASETDVLLEEKPAGFVFHWRTCPESEPSAMDFAKSLVEGQDDFELHRAKAAVEIKPGGVSKAEAVRRLVEACEPAEDVCLVAIGDDATDEDMFAEVARNGGVSIRVGPGETVADHRLDGVEAVHALLENELNEMESRS